MTLLQFLRQGKASIPRGAISRAAEHLGVTYSTMRYFVSGDRQPGLETRRKIQDMIHARINLKPRNPNVTRRSNGGSWKQSKV